MKFPNGDALTAMIEDELERGISLVKMLERIADDPQKITLNMVFFPVKVNVIEGTPFVFIPLGTKEKPAGISNTECKYALVFDEDDILVFSIDIIKSYIKQNFKSLEWTIDKWFETMGFNISLKRLVEFERDHREVKQ